MSRARNGFTHLSKHAACRLGQRTVFREEEIIAMLDNYFFVSLGIETGFNREHCLVYCRFTNDYYVAVQDIKLGTVITVLPLDYHQNLSWKIDRDYISVNDELLRKAKASAIYKIASGKMPPSISLKVRYVTCCGKLKVSTMKKFIAAKYNCNPELILENRNKISNLVSQWSRGKDLAKIVDVFSAQGRSSTPSFCTDDFVEELNYKFGLVSPAI